MGEGMDIVVSLSPRRVHRYTTSGTDKTETKSETEKRQIDKNEQKRVLITGGQTIRPKQNFFFWRIN